MNRSHPRLFALLLTLVFFGLIVLYVREFPLLGNTIGARYLVIGSMLVGLAAASLVIWRLRDRFTPWDRHLPGVSFIVVSALFFAPLLGSYVNRWMGADTFQSFTFVSEIPFVASGYGILKGEKIKPTGYRLTVEENGKLLHFTYKSQAYYPLTKPAEQVMLPIKKGVLGARIMLLK